MSSTESSSQKAIKEVLRRPPSHWVGDGFKVFPVFADKAFTKELSPFLMFDYAAPKEFPPSSSSSSHRRGVGQHPHRGFETVTIAFQGEVQHRDSTGNSGIIGPGDCQWMTAAKGIVHEEFHSEEFAKRGGVFEMCQLWVNLPKKYKMSNAKYQGILDGQIPRVPLLERERNEGQEGVCTSSISSNSNKEEKLEDDGANSGYVRVIAGSFRGEKGPAETFTPINMWDIILPNGENKEFELDVEKGHTTLLFVRRGEVKIQEKILGLADVAIMTREGTKITVQSLAKDTSLLVLSGEPIDEPIAARGPFVMNTYQELMEAMQDYNHGRNGFHHF